MAFATSYAFFLVLFFLILRVVKLVRMEKTHVAGKEESEVPFAL